MSLDTNHVLRQIISQLIESQQHIMLVDETEQLFYWLSANHLHHTIQLQEIIFHTTHGNKSIGMGNKGRKALFVKDEQSYYVYLHLNKANMHQFDNHKI